MKKRTLYEELAIVDGALAELEERRTNIVNRIDAGNSRERGSSKVLSFPNRVAVISSPRGFDDDWPKGSKAKALDKE